MKVGDAVQVEHGRMKMLYPAKILSIDEKNKTVEIRYDVCQQIEIVEMELVNLVDLESGRPSRISKKPNRLTMDKCSGKKKSYKDLNEEDESESESGRYYDNRKSVFRSSYDKIDDFLDDGFSFKFEDDGSTNQIKFKKLIKSEKDEKVERPKRVLGSVNYADNSSDDDNEEEEEEEKMQIISEKCFITKKRKKTVALKRKKKNKKTKMNKPNKIFSSPIAPRVLSSDAVVVSPESSSSMSNDKNVDKSESPNHIIKKELWKKKGIKPKGNKNLTERQLTRRLYLKDRKGLPRKTFRRMKGGKLGDAGGSIATLFGGKGTGAWPRPRNIPLFKGRTNPFIKKNEIFVACRIDW